MKAINQNKKLLLKESAVEYETVAATNFVFGKISKEDFLLDPRHDELAEKASKKYFFRSLKQLKVGERLTLSKGILDEKSAKKHLGGQLNKIFVVVRGCPTFEGKQQQWQSLVVNIAISTGNYGETIYKLVPMRVSSVVDILPYEARVAIMSHVAHEVALEKNQLADVRLPSKYARYNVMAGADLADVSEEKLVEMRAATGPPRAGCTGVGPGASNTHPGSSPAPPSSSRARAPSTQTAWCTP